MTLPEGVEKAIVRKKNGKVYTYYYWNPGRGTEREGERGKLRDADTKPVAFWAEVDRRHKSEPTTYSPNGAQYTADGLRAMGALARRHRGRPRNLSPLEEMGGRPGQKVRMGHRP